MEWYCTLTAIIVYAIGFGVALEGLSKTFNHSADMSDAIILAFIWPIIAPIAFGLAIGKRVF